jgi:hypothetical protein
VSAAHRLRVIEETPVDFEVWLDTAAATGQAHDGLCLGGGATREAALVQARVELAHALEKVDQHIARLKHPNGASRSAWEGGAV